MVLLQRAMAGDVVAAERLKALGLGSVVAALSARTVAVPTPPQQQAIADAVANVYGDQTAVEDTALPIGSVPDDDDSADIPPWANAAAPAVSAQADAKSALEAARLRAAARARPRT